MITISDSAVRKIKTIIAEEDPSLKLRVFVQGGGCSGFQYGFTLEEYPPNEDDMTFERDGVGVVIDTIRL
jgi:iron-sulfur cluster insertion protein